MKYQDKIATGKVDRTIKFVKTGAKIGGNYIKHYAKKVVNPDLDKEELHRDNAGDIFETLSELKGSALKVAQMLSMDKGVLPKAYSEKFTLAQYSAPPLSGPLVVKTFSKTLGKSPFELYDEFNLNAVNAASIGQVHVAYKNKKKLAVKVQYPGVAESIKSDLKIVKPIALRMFGLSEKDLDKYIQEVEGKLIEETDYRLELKRSKEISDASKHIQNLIFPNYYPELSSDKVLTMDWLSGNHLIEFVEKENPSQEIRDKIGQALWDFFEFQIHTLKKVHADPHPGNFLFNSDGKVGIIDFGCVKEIPEDFYHDYFALLIPELIDNEEMLLKIMGRIEMLYNTDTPNLQKAFKDAFIKMTKLLATPFRNETFDFGNDEYIESIYKLGEEISNDKILKSSKDGRGSRHMLYINRTYFGIYSMLNQLKAKVEIGPKTWHQVLLKYHVN